MKPKNNNNNIIWNKTTEVEPPARTQVWVCQAWRNRVRKQIRLDSWDPIKKEWKNHGGHNLDGTYWTYPVYPEIK